MSDEVQERLFPVADPKPVEIEGEWFVQEWVKGYWRKRKVNMEKINGA